MSVANYTPELTLGARVSKLEAQIATARGAERLPRLVELSELLPESDPVRARALADEAVRVAEEIGDVYALSRTLLHVAKLHFLLGEDESAWQLMRRVEPLIPPDAVDLRISYHIGRAGLFHGEDQVVKAMEELKMALQLADEENPRRTEILIHSGFVYTGLGLYDQALSTLLEALDRLEERGSDRSDLPVICHAHLADVYGALGDFDRMRRHAYRGIEVSDPTLPSHRVRTAPLCTILGIDAKDQGRLDEALDYFRRGLAMLDPNQQLSHRSHLIMHVGRTLALMGRHQEGKQTLYEALELAVRVGPPSAEARIHSAIAEMLRKEGDRAGAIEHLKKALEQTEDVAHFVRPWVLDQLASIYEELGEKETSYAFYREHVDLRDRLRGEDVQRRIAQITLAYELARAESERNTLRERAERSEDEAARIRRELAAAALNLIQKREGLRKLKQDLLHEGRTGRKQRQQLVDDLVRQIDEQLAGDQDWDRFENRLDTTHTEFVAQLARCSPELTPTELRVCALIRIDLSTKEMADLLSVSLHTANTHRRNIRRKLGLSIKDNLRAYLLRI